MPDGAPAGTGDRASGDAFRDPGRIVVAVVVSAGTVVAACWATGTETTAAG